MQINPYLFFAGQCKEAFEFYERCLGGKIEVMMNHRGTPAAEHVSEDHLDSIIHARIAIGDQVLMGSDSPPEYYAKPQGMRVVIHIKDPAEAERVFSALTEGGAVMMPMEETFFAVRFGMGTDKFGIPWMVNCEKAM